VETIVSPASALEAGLVAQHQGHYSEAIGILEAFCHDCAVTAQTASRDYLRAQMHLIKIYEQIGQVQRAVVLCHQLIACTNAQVQIWAQQHLEAMAKPKPAPAESNAVEQSIFSKLKQTIAALKTRPLSI
jgi:hypothetical protein